MSHAASDIAPSPPKRLRRALISAAAVLGMLVLSIASYIALTSYFLRTEAQVTPQRAAFFANAMDAALTRLEHLPYVLSIDPQTRDALVTGDVDLLNPLLADIADRSAAEFVYLLDTAGLTIASSNYADADTLVGNHYTFRPYFRDAIAGDAGRFYAVGVTTGRPGYFIAEPVRDTTGTILGVLTVKIGFGDLIRVLADSGELLLVTDDKGVVIASSDSALTYGHIAPLTRADLIALEEQQRFGDQILFPLDWSPEDDGRVRLDGAAYVWTEAALTQEDWTLHLLTEVGDIRRQAFLYVAVGVITLLALLVAAAIFRAAQLRKALAISNADRRRLAAEIEDRKIAEQKLETARAALARKNQLAALGQMSASITHELGQPISAMRNYLAAEEIATDAAPGSVMPQVSGLVDRMQRILNQLRQFGQSTPAPATSFTVQDAVRAACQMMQHTADEAGVTLDIALPTGDIMLQGHPQRFEQVIVNLLRNGIDAVDGQPDGLVLLALQDGPAALTLTVADNGPGLGDLDITDLREPFFSTKPSGKGMGLGLAISGQIVNEMGGTLQASNAETGAVFTVTFAKSVPNA